MVDYEFRFYRDEAFQAVHMSALESDSAACQRARLYLQNQPGLSHVEVRRGFRFMRKITNDWLPGEKPGGLG